MAKTYAIVVGLVLTLVGILGFVKGQQGMFGLQFSLMHNVVHLLSGLLGLAAGFGGGTKAARLYAQVFGVIYTLVAIVGFAGAPVALIAALNLNTSYNVIHLAVGVIGLAAGFAGAKEAAA